MYEWRKIHMYYSEDETVESCRTSSKNYKNVHSNVQFMDEQNLYTLIYQVIGGLVGR